MPEKKSQAVKETKVSPTKEKAPVKKVEPKKEIKAEPAKKEEVKPAQKEVEKAREPKKEKPQKVKVEKVLKAKLTSPQRSSIAGLVFSLFSFFVTTPIGVGISLPGFVFATLAILNYFLDFAEANFALLGLIFNLVGICLSVIAEIFLGIAKGFADKALGEENKPFKGLRNASRPFIVIATIATTLALILVSIGFAISLISFVLLLG